MSQSTARVAPLLTSLADLTADQTASPGKVRSAPTTTMAPTDQTLTASQIGLRD